MTYTETRLHNLQKVKKVKNINPILRVFTGDNRERQFERRQPRASGGKFRCVCGVPKSNSIADLLTLEERRKHVVAGEAWHYMSTGVVNPFKGLKKGDMLLQLETRGI